MFVANIRSVTDPLIVGPWVHVEQINKAKTKASNTQWLEEQNVLQGTRALCCVGQGEETGL